MTGPWVIGELFNVFWTFSGSDDGTEFNYFVTQPFVDFGISRTTVFNERPMTLSVQYYTNVEYPAGVAGQQLRLQVSLLYPKPKK